MEKSPFGAISISASKWSALLDPKLWHCNRPVACTRPYAMPISCSWFLCLFFHFFYFIQFKCFETVNATHTKRLYRVELMQYSILNIVRNIFSISCMDRRFSLGWTGHRHWFFFKWHACFTYAEMHIGGYRRFNTINVCRLACIE